MRDLGVSRLADLTPMIPEENKSGSWPLVYRELCEWAVLYDLICYRSWGSDTLIIRFGHRAALALAPVVDAGAVEQMAAGAGLEAHQPCD